MSDRVRPTGRSAQRFTPSAIAIPLAVTAAIWAAFVGFEAQLSTVLGLVNVFICTRQLILAVAAPLRGPIQLIFWSFALIWIAIPSIIQLSWNEFPWPEYGTEGLFWVAQALTTLAFLSFILGVRLARKRSEATQAAQRATPVRPRIALLLIIGLALLPFVILASGGLSARFETREAVGGNLEEAGVTGDTVTLFLLNRLPAAVALVAGYLATRNLRHAVRDDRSRVMSYFLATTVAVILIALLANPFSSSRYVAFSALAGILLGAIALRSVRWKAVFASALSVGMLVIYPLATWFKKDTTQTARSIDLSTYTGIDFDGFQMTVNAIAYVQEHGIAYGQHVLAALGYFIPRSIWADKPLPASFDVAESRGYAFQNLSLPVWSEFYVDAGLIGMALLMCGYGYAATRLDALYVLRPNTLPADLAVLVAIGQFGFIRGPLGGSMVFFGTVVLLGLLALWGRKPINTAHVDQRLARRRLRSSVE